MYPIWEGGLEPRRSQLPKRAAWQRSQARLTFGCPHPSVSRRYRMRPIIDSKNSVVPVQKRTQTVFVCDLPRQRDTHTVIARETGILRLTPQAGTCRSQPPPASTPGGGFAFAHTAPPHLRTFGRFTPRGHRAAKLKANEPNEQMQRDADKGIKTRNSGESGYVANEEKPGASAHPPGQPNRP
jgi:hypothetical protein